MKRLLSLLLLLPLSLTAQQYWNTDDFSGGTENWNTAAGTNSVASLELDEVNDLLAFHLLETSTSGEVYWTWTEAGTSGADWSVYFDFDFNSTSVVDDQNLTWFLNASSGSNSVNVGVSLVAGASNAYGGVSWSETDIVSFADMSGTIGLAYDSTNKLLIAGYDSDGATNDYVFATISSYDISAWESGSSVDIYASLGMSYSTSSTAFSALSGSDVMADNFTVTDVNVSAVPEPSTYAALFGLTALGAALWRRRRRTIA